MHKTVTPKDAKALIDDQSYTYVDVRSEFEFERGHPVGAYNVPLLHMQPGVGMVPNPLFLDVMKANFDKDARLVLGCKSGGRSERACEILDEAGYSNVVNMDGGFEGRFDPLGRVAQPGWSAEGYPSTTDADGKSYEYIAPKP